MDYFLNKGNSKIEKMWERERKKKLAKARKQKKSEAEKLQIKSDKSKPEVTLPKPPSDPPRTVS